MICCSRYRPIYHSIYSMVTLTIHICFLRGTEGNLANLNRILETRNSKSLLLRLSFSHFLHYIFINRRVLLSSSMIVDKCLDSFLLPFIICKIMINSFFLHMYLNVVSGTRNLHFFQYFFFSKESSLKLCTCERNKK